MAALCQVTARRREGCKTIRASDQWLRKCNRLGMPRPCLSPEVLEKGDKSSLCSQRGNATAHKAYSRNQTKHRTRPARASPPRRISRISKRSHPRSGDVDQKKGMKRRKGRKRRL